MSKIRACFIVCIIVFWISAIHAQTPDEAWILTDMWELPAPPESGISQVVINPDRTKMVVVYTPSNPFALTTDEEKFAYAQIQTELWDIPTRTKIATLPNQSVNIWQMSINPTGDFILIPESLSSENRRYSIWDAQTGDFIRAVEGFIISTTFSPDGSTFTYFDVESSTLFVSDTLTGDILAQNSDLSAETDQFPYVWAVAHHPNQPVLAIGGQIQRYDSVPLPFYDIYLWNYVSNEQVIIDNTNENGNLSHLTFLEDGDYLVWWGGNMRHTYHLTQADYPRTDIADFRMKIHAGEIHTVSMTADSFTPPFIGHLYDIRTNTRYATISEGPITAGVFFSPDEAYLFTVIFADMHQWDAQTGAYLGMVYDDPDGTYNQYTFMPDASQLWIHNSNSSIIRIFMARG